MSSKIVFPVKSLSSQTDTHVGQIGTTYFDVVKSALCISDGNRWITLGSENVTSAPSDSVSSRSVSDSIVVSGVQALKVLTIPAIRISSTSPPSIGSIAYDTQTSSIYYSGPTGWSPLAGSNLSSAGTGISLISNGTPPNLSTKSLRSGTGVSISSTTTEITIAGAYIAGANISIDSFGVISATGSLGVNSVTAANNTIVISGTLSDPQIAANYVSGTAISITGGNTINNTGVTSATGTLNQIDVSSATGNIVISLSPNATTNSLTVTGSLTLSGLVSPSFLFTTTGGLVASSGVPSNGQLLIGSSLGDPVLSNITTPLGSGISITNGPGTINIANTGVKSLTAGAGITITPIGSTTGDLTIIASGTAGVGTFSTVLDGLTPQTPTSGAVVLSGNLGVNGGGTGNVGPYLNGQILIGNGTGLTKSTITAVGGGIGVTNGVGSITLSNTGVLSFSAGTTGLLPGGATTGAVVLSGVLARANGGTGLSAAPINGQLLIGNGAGYTLATITAGSGITITNGAGTISIAATGGAGVSSFSAGTTGLLPGGATTGAVVLSGVLARANGGTGLATAPTNGQLLIGNGAGYTLATITAGSGSGITITNGAGTISIANAGVRQVLAGTEISLSPGTGLGIVTIGRTQTASCTYWSKSNQTFPAGTTNITTYCLCSLKFGPQATNINPPFASPNFSALNAIPSGAPTAMIDPLISETTRVFQCQVAGLYLCDYEIAVYNFDGDLRYFWGALLTGNATAVPAVWQMVPSSMRQIYIANSTQHTIHGSFLVQGVIAQYYALCVASYTNTGNVRVGLTDPTAPLAPFNINTSGSPSLTGGTYQSTVSITFTYLQSSYT
jgi:hypothetical protein